MSEDIPGVGSGATGASSPSQTTQQPMRVVDASAPTMPPPMKGKPLDKKDGDAKPDDKAAEAGAPTEPVATADTGEVKKPD